MCMNPNSTYIRAVFFTLFLLVSMVVFAQPSDDFTTTVEGWGTVGDPGSSPGATWSAASGGCVTGTDASVGAWYWYASDASWKGNMSAYYDCELYFDLKQSSVIIPINQYDLMIIRGDDEVIVYNTLYNPAVTWTSYIVPLSESGWTHGVPGGAGGPSYNLGGAAVTAAEMISWLSDVKRIRIRAEYSGLNSETNYLDNVEIICTPIGLPVELSEFTVEEAGFQTARLDWTTLSETNCEGFQIEKSENGLVFDSLTFITGHGSTTDIHMYDYFDDNFTTTSYYRLKQKDFNGKGFYSDVITLQSKTIPKSSIQIFPNPVTDYLVLTSGADNSLLAYEITDITGRTLLKMQVEPYSGLYENTISLKFLESGIYIITCYKKSGKESQTFEVIK